MIGPSRCPASRPLFLLFAASATLLACASEPPGEVLGSSTTAVVAGVKTPDGLGVEINRVERGAVLGQILKSGTKKDQGCSGTLVGDRLVVSAGHCVVVNLGEWLSEGAAPEAVAEGLHYASGENAKTTSCLLEAESVHLHPEMRPNAVKRSIEHDVALIVLKESALSRCPGLVPVQLNLEPLGPELVGQRLLQGGFGSLNDTHAFSPVRYWSELELARLDDQFVVATDVGKGFPSYGDSGAGVLYRFPDGSLRNIGVCSSDRDPVGSRKAMGFVRTDLQREFYESLATPERVCGSVGPEGACSDGALVRCGPSGFTSVDCRADGLECVLDDAAKAACACTCDQQPFCDEGCACDPVCNACACDLSSGCDADCACDAECKQDAASPPAASACAAAPTPPSGGGGAGLIPLGLTFVVAALAARRRAT